MDITPDSDETAAPKPIPFSANIDFSAEAEQEVKGKGRRGRPRKTDLQPKAAQPKRGRGHPRKASGDVANPPPPKKARPDAAGEGEKGVVIAPPPPKKAKTDFAAEGVSQPPKRGRGRPPKPKVDEGKGKAPAVHAHVLLANTRLERFLELAGASLNGRSATAVLSQLQRRRVAKICDMVCADAAVYDSIVDGLNALPQVYAAQHAHLSLDNQVLGLFHPALFQTYKPVYTTGDGNCLFHALSLALTGTESCTDLVRLLTVHALVKCKSTVMGAYRDAYPGRTEQQHLAHFNAGMREAVTVGRWGTDEHLFALACCWIALYFSIAPTPTMAFLPQLLLNSLLSCFSPSRLRQGVMCSTVPVRTGCCSLVETSAGYHYHPLPFSTCRTATGWPCCHTMHLQWCTCRFLEVG